MSAPVAEGDVVLEKYRVERVLGEGGMGVVVAATHVDLDKRVALKFLLPDALAHPELVERFAREARAAAKIQSQHVARVIDTGKMPNGAPFMVMEYLEGRDLANVIEQEGPLSLAVAVDYVLQACDAIAEAHSAGIVHRDLKPANLFLAQQRDRRGIVKVLDFGISKVEDPKAAPLTRTATMMGSPLYMSPEQLTSSKDVDARTDIWALGVILYELVSGQRPFDGETMPEVVAQILRNQPRPLQGVRTDVPRDFELVVTRCLSTSAEHRFRTVAEFVTALQPFAGDVAAAGAAVARISRVLGGQSLPPNDPSTVGIRVAPSPIDVPRSSEPHFSTNATLVLPGQVQTAPALTVSDVRFAPRNRFLVLIALGALLFGSTLYVVVRTIAGSRSSRAVGVGLVASNAAPPAIPVVSGSVAAAAPPESISVTASASPEAVATVITRASAVPSSVVDSTADEHRRGTTSAPPRRSSPNVPPGARASASLTPAAVTAKSSSNEPSKSPLNMGIK